MLLDHHLRPVDDVVVAVADDRAFDVGRIGGRHRRLGHQERRADAAFQQRREPLRLLLRVAVAREHFHVAGVRGTAIEDRRGPVDASHQFRERRVFEVGQARAPGLVFVGQEQVPEPGFARPGLESFDHGRDDPALRRILHELLVFGLGREDVRLHEVVDTMHQFARAGAVFEIHDGCSGVGLAASVGPPWHFPVQCFNE